MTPTADTQMKTNLLSFQVSTATGHVHAFLSHASCQAGQPAAGAPLNLRDFVNGHKAALEEVVRAKLHAGARSPVVLMARDLVESGTGGQDGLR